MFVCVGGFYTIELLTYSRSWMRGCVVYHEALQTRVEFELNSERSYYLQLTHAHRIYTSACRKASLKFLSALTLCCFVLH